MLISKSFRGTHPRLAEEREQLTHRKGSRGCHTPTDGQTPFTCLDAPDTAPSMGTVLHKRDWVSGWE